MVRCAAFLEGGYQALCTLQQRGPVQPTCVDDVILRHRAHLRTDRTVFWRTVKLCVPKLRPCREKRPRGPNFLSTMPAFGDSQHYPNAIGYQVPSWMLFFDRNGEKCTSA